MAIYVLVHGAWGGSYGWKKVRPLLQAAGHDVYTPSLTGLGERAHLSSPSVDLSLHIQDVANTIEFEDLEGIVLVGYSYGGMVVTGVADRMPDRIDHLVYLDAFLPKDGQSLYSMTGTSPPQSEDWLVPAVPRQFDDPAEQAWHEARRQSHPRACFTESVHLSVPLEKRPFSLTYIKATADARPVGGEGPGGPFWQAADRTRNDPAWRYREVDCDHLVPQKKPQELAAILLELA
jgi:pimeloyl-ACP methyl ester carboxylesterase